ncbi:MAG: iron-containing alcohol dehydrogenase [Sarcina sp.]
MENFTVYNPTDIFFGKDVEEAVGEEIKKYGNKVLFHYGEGSIKESGLYSKMLEILNQAGIRLIELGGVEKNPKKALVDKGIEFCKKNNIDFILAIGGGSVVDSAKAIALGANYEGDIWEAFENEEEIEEALPVGIVLTNPGSGSEVSNFTVLTNEETKEKKSYQSNSIYPKFSFLNPELCYTLNDKQIGSVAAEIVSHLIERYLINEKNVEITNRLIEGTLKTVINNVYKVLENKESYEGYTELLWSAAVAQNDILSASYLRRVEHHHIEDQLCGTYDLDHGMSLSITYPAIMRYLAESHGDRLIQLGRRVFNINNADLNQEDLIEETIESLERFYQSINMPIRLSEIGIEENDILPMVNKITKNGILTINEFKSLNKEDIYNIYKLAL